MERLSYEDYVQYGGKSSVDDFPIFIIDAEQLVIKVTSGKINNYELTEPIKRLLVRLIDDVLVSQDGINVAVTSYSDGIESISYNNDAVGGNGIVSQAYELCKLYLPDILIYRGVKSLWEVL